MSWISTHSLVSDLDFERELSQWLRMRFLEQKFLYMGEGAKKYYWFVRPRGWASREDDIRIRDFSWFIMPKINKEVTWAIISLGCGDAFYESAIIRSLVIAGYRIAYFWVDASRSMLDMAYENMKHVECESKKLICADILSEEFRGEIKNLTSEYSYRIYSFFNGTYWNMSQAYITDSLYGILEKNDLLWFNVATRSWLDAKNEMLLFERYSERFLWKEKDSKWVFHALEEVGIHFEKWNLRLDLQREEPSSTLLFSFSFVFNEKVVLDYRGERFHYLAGEKISLLDVRVFFAEKIVDFFRNHEFEYLDQNADCFDDIVSWAQFLFRKA